MCFGRYLAQYIWSNCVTIASESEDNRIWDGIENILKQLKVRFDIRHPPENGSWTVRGKDAEKIMKRWNEIAVLLNVEHTIMAVHNLSRGMRVLFTWAATTPEEKNEEQWFKDNFKNVVDQFATLIANDADPNYFHEFKYHAVPGLLKYSNDVQETVNCEIKGIFHRFTQRGGGKYKEHWALTVMKRRAVRIMVCVDDKGPQNIPHLKYEARKLKEKLRNM